MSSEPLFTSEDNLLEVFGQHHGPPPGTCRLLEVAGVQGIPDVVDVRLRDLPPGVPPEVLAAALGAPTRALILSLLRRHPPRSRSYLAQSTGLAPRTLQEHLRWLERAGMVCIRGTGSVALRHALPWHMADLTVYEGKMSQWRRALSQALGYRSFARTVHIVMPAARVHRALRGAGLFRTHGIGLIGVDPDGTQTRHADARAHPRPTSRRLYYLAIGVILSRLLQDPHWRESYDGDRYYA